jgi:hypothetical protein
MLSMGIGMDAEAQSGITDSLRAASHAISAKVGDAARHSQSAMPWFHKPSLCPFLAARNFVILCLPFDPCRFRPLLNWKQM